LLIALTVEVAYLSLGLVYGCTKLPCRRQVTVGGGTPSAGHDRVRGSFWITHTFCSPLTPGIVGATRERYGITNKLSLKHKLYRYIHLKKKALSTWHCKSICNVFILILKIINYNVYLYVYIHDIL